MHEMKMLIVDDSPTARCNLESYFSEDFDLFFAQNGKDAITTIKKLGTDIDVVIMDENMPEISGIEVIKNIRRSTIYKNLPIVMISDNENCQLEALEVGAWDFISKNNPRQIVRARINNVLARKKSSDFKSELETVSRILVKTLRHSHSAIFEYNVEKDELFLSGSLITTLGYPSRIKKASEFFKTSFTNEALTIEKAFKDITPKNSYADTEVELNKGKSDSRWVHISLHADYNKEKKVALLSGFVSDIHDFKTQIHENIQRAEHDPLTGLLNRCASEKLIRTALKDKDSHSAFIIIDVDNFKSINDTYGHDVGDEMLKKIGRRIKKSFRGTDFIARYGGDEFTAFAYNITTKDNLEKRLMQLLENIHTSITLDDKIINQTISIGASFIKKDEIFTFEKIFKTADLALYESKKKGKNCFTISVL